MATVSNHKTLNCPLCFKTFTTPRVLPCLHSFCDKCLNTHIEQSVHPQSESKFTCPLCAAETVSSDINLTIDKWASHFPLDTLLSSVIDSSTDLDDGEDKCEPCKSDGENKVAEFWCTICKEKLCSSCNRSHKRNKLLRDHTTVCFDEKEQNKQSSINFDQECGHHRSKTKELFCLDHRELCCAVCVATDHRQCNDVRSIDDISRDQSQRSTFDYPSIIRDLSELKTEIKKIMTKKNTNANQVLHEKDQILFDMDNRIDTIISHLNKLRKEFREQTGQLYEDTERSILKKEKTLKRFVTNVENSEEIMEVVETSGTPKLKFTIFENVRSQIALHYDQLQSELKDDVEVHFSVKSNPVLDDIQGSLNSLGLVDLTSSSSATSRDALQSANKAMKNLNSRGKIKTEMCAAQVEKVEDLMTSPVTLVKSVTRDKLGRSTCLTGGTFLGDGRLVMCDFDNRRLVELDDEYNVVNVYEVDGNPIDVAAGNKDNEIYIVDNQKQIYKCALDTDPTIVNIIQSSSDICGIAVSGDNIIVSIHDAVVILTQDGSTVRSIPKSGYNSYVAVSQTQRTIYHSDNVNVICRTLEGQEVFRYQHPQLKAPRGLHVDRHGYLYICGKTSHNVHQVSSSDGQRSRIIQLHNISQPTSVILHPQKNELLVASYCEEDTVCEIYKLG